MYPLAGLDNLTHGAEKRNVDHNFSLFFRRHIGRREAAWIQSQMNLNILSVNRVENKRITLAGSFTPLDKFFSRVQMGLRRNRKKTVSVYFTCTLLAH